MRLAFVVACSAISLLGGCTFYGAGIHVLAGDPARAFTDEDEEAARRITIEHARAVGFWETDTAQQLAAQESSRPYVAFVSLGAPGGTIEQRSISILGSMRKDRREILVSVQDYERGEPLPATRQLIDDLGAALERAFPDCRVEVRMRRKHRLFGP